MRCPGHGPASYPEADIQVFDGFEHVRLRPGMYIGGTDARGLHRMLFDLVRGSLAAGTGSLDVALFADGAAEVADSAAPPPDVELAYSRLHTLHGEMYIDGHRPQWPYGVANALAEGFTVRVRTPGSVYQHAFRRGVTHAALQSGGPPADRGLTVRFRPDPLIFGDARFDPGTVRDWLRRCAFLHSGLHISFTDPTGRRDDFAHADGIAAYVRWLNAARTPLHPEAIVVRGETDGVRYEVGLQWCSEVDESVLTFANGYHTRLGGTHETGFRTAVTRTVNDLIRNRHPGTAVVAGEDARSGLTAVVAVRVAEAYFAGATREQLRHPEAERAVASGVGSGLRGYLDANADVAAAVVRNALAARDGRKRK